MGQQVTVMPPTLGLISSMHPFDDLILSFHIILTSPSSPLKSQSPSPLPSSPPPPYYYTYLLPRSSDLDGLCFGKGMSGTQLDKPSKGLDILEKLLSNNEFLVNNQFSVADVAVASYLNYVPVFFGNVRKLPNRPSIARYMVTCANRPAFAKAFGDDHAKLVSQKVPTWV